MEAEADERMFEEDRRERMEEKERQMRRTVPVPEKERGRDLR